MKEADVDFVYIGSSSFLMANRERFTSEALKVGLPVATDYDPAPGTVTEDAVNHFAITKGNSIMAATGERRFRTAVNRPVRQVFPVT